VTDKPAEFIAVDANKFMRALLYDADLSIDLLGLVSQRCIQANGIISDLMDGISAAYHGDEKALRKTAQQLRLHKYSLAEAADLLVDLKR